MSLIFAFLVGHEFNIILSRRNLIKYIPEFYNIIRVFHIYLPLISRKYIIIMFDINFVLILCDLSECIVYNTLV